MATMTTTTRTHATTIPAITPALMVVDSTDSCGVTPPQISGPTIYHHKCLMGFIAKIKQNCSLDNITLTIVCTGHSKC